MRLAQLAVPVAFAALTFGACKCVDVSSYETACESDGSCPAGKVCCNNRCLTQCFGGGIGGGGGPGGGAGGGAGGVGGGAGGVGGGAGGVGGGAGGVGGGAGGVGGGAGGVGGGAGGVGGGAGGVGGGAGGVGGGGGGGGGGAAGCNATNCAGTGLCCASDGGCVATGAFNGFDYRCRGPAGTCNVCGPQVANACGGGGTCLCGTLPVCSPGQSCNGSACTCSASSCPAGCCLNGQCIPTSVSNCRKSGGLCGACGPEADGCGSGATGCTCGGGPACPAGQVCQDGRCTCDGTSNCQGCCASLDGGPAACVMQNDAACGRGGTCFGCKSTMMCNGATTGLCQGCSVSCQTCCQGDACAPATASLTSAFPLCAVNLTNSACEQCNEKLSDRCDAVGRGCACGAEPQCGLGASCVTDGGAPHCECDPLNCAGCCEDLGGGRSRCVGTLSISACAAPGSPAPKCGSCLDAGISADNCTMGVCRCGPNAACPSPLRCFKDQCVN